MYEDRAIYGAPAVDGVTVKATLDGRGTVTGDPDAFPRELSEAEIAETLETVSNFIPGLIPDHCPLRRVSGPLYQGPQPAVGMA